MHVSELGPAEGLSLTNRDLDRVEDVRERDLRRIRHVGVPLLAGVREADWLTVLDAVRQGAHFRMAFRVEGTRGPVDSIEIAELCAEHLETIDWGGPELGRRGVAAGGVERYAARARGEIGLDSTQSRCWTIID